MLGLGAQQTPAMVGPAEPRPLNLGPTFTKTQ